LADFRQIRVTSARRSTPRSSRRSWGRGRPARARRDRLPPRRRRPGLAPSRRHVLALVELRCSRRCPQTAAGTVPRYPASSRKDTMARSPNRTAASTSNAVAAHEIGPSPARRSAAAVRGIASPLHATAGAASGAHSAMKARSGCSRRAGVGDGPWCTVVAQPLGNPHKIPCFAGERRARQDVAGSGSPRRVTVRGRQERFRHRGSWRRGGGNLLR